MASQIGPKSLADLKLGSTIDGDSGSRPDVPPAWLDKARYDVQHTT